MDSLPISPSCAAGSVAGAAGPAGQVLHQNPAWFDGTQVPILGAEGSFAASCENPGVGEMREQLLEVIFHESGRLRLDRLESLLDVVGQDAPAPGKELIPVAGAGLRLLFSRDGADLRKRLLMTLIRDDRLHTDDVRALVGLLGRTFGPRRLAGGLLRGLNPLAAA